MAHNWGRKRPLPFARGRGGGFQAHTKPAPIGAGGAALEVTLSLAGTGDRFITKSRYSSALNEVYRGHGGAFDRDAKSWSLPLSAYAAVCDGIVQAGGPGLTLNRIPPALLNEAGGTVQAAVQPSPLVPEGEAREMIAAALPAAMLEELRPFQVVGIATAVRRGGRVLIGDEMGLGKTVQAIATAYHFAAEWPLLIVCPSSLRFTWAAEIDKWLGIDGDAVQVLVSAKDSPTALICIVSYDIATKLAPRLGAFRVVVADECHYLKSPDAKRTKALVPLIQKAKRAILLSGTPALSRPVELFTQLNALAPDRFRSLAAFGKRYCNGHQGRFGWDFSGSSNLGELHGIMASSVMIRRLKRDVLTQLPPKIRQRVPIDVAPKEARELGALIRRQGALDAKIKAAGAAATVAMDNARRALVTELYGETGRAKLPGCLDYVDEMLTKGTKLIVFAHHKEVLDGIADRLAKRKVRHIRIDGDTPAGIRQELCDRFQEEDAMRVAVLSITAAGVGLTLHAAQMVIFAELYWNRATPPPHRRTLRRTSHPRPAAGSMMQAEDRAHRIGLQHTVDVRYLVARAGSDESLWKLIQKKLSVVGESVNGEKSRLSLDGTAASDGTAKEGPLDRHFAPTVGVSSAGAARPEHEGGGGGKRLRLTDLQQPGMSDEAALQAALRASQTPDEPDDAALQAALRASLDQSGAAVAVEECPMCSELIPAPRLAAHVAGCTALPAGFSD